MPRHSKRRGEMFETEPYRKNWLMRVARNLSISLIRRNSKFEFETIDDNLESNLNFIDAVENEKVNAIIAILENLDIIYKIVFEMFYIQDRKISDIARELEMTECAVKKRLQRTRDIIKQELLICLV